MYRNCGVRMRNFLCVLLALILFTSGWLSGVTGSPSFVRADEDAEAKPAYNATVYIYGVGEYLNVRNVAGTKNSYVIDQIFRGQRVCINRYETVEGDPSGYDSWADITYINRGNVVHGHVVTKNLVSDVECTSSFEKEIADFPESYKPYLRLLHTKFPKWKFKAVKATADWDTVMEVETELGNSVISKYAYDTWKSHEKGAYNASTGKYTEVDSGGWVNAAREVVAYYLDPRNMLFDSQVFQFLDLGYDPKVQTSEAVGSILEGTFMNQWNVLRDPTPTPFVVLQSTDDDFDDPSDNKAAVTPKPDVTGNATPAPSQTPEDPGETPVPTNTPEEPVETPVPSTSPEETGETPVPTKSSEEPSETPVPTSEPTSSPDVKKSSKPSSTPAAEVTGSTKKGSTTPKPSEAAEVTKKPSESAKATVTKAPSSSPKATATPTTFGTPTPTLRPMIPTNTPTPRKAGPNELTHLKALMEAAEISGISPVYLASKIIQEVGAGGSDSIFGTGHNGLYPGYYNYYNIAAYAADGYDAMGRGLWYASQSDGASEQFMRPWNTGYKAIVGGALWQAKYYYQAGQDTLYLMKFNVMPSDPSMVGRHEYMTNVRALENESYHMYEAYRNIGILKSELTFRIPVFDNMPDEACHLPTTVGPDTYIRDIHLSLLKQNAAGSYVTLWTGKIMKDDLNAYVLAYNVAYNPGILLKKMDDETYIKYMYKALLEKDPSTKIVSSYLEKFEGGMTRSDFVEELLNSNLFAMRLKKYGISKKTFKRTEAQKNYDNQALFIDRLYSTALSRETDLEGFNYWVSRVRNDGMTYSDLSAYFALCEEAQNTYKTRAAFITMLYKAIYDREPDEEGFAYWKACMDFGMTREEVVEGFLNSQEFVNLCERFGGNQGSYSAKKRSGLDRGMNILGVSGFVKRMYEVVLDRECEAVGYNYWGKQICMHKFGGSDMAVHFVFSQEYVEKETTDKEYVTMLYRAIMGREPESDGMKFWLKSLKDGKTRRWVLNSFIDSKEYSNICESYGIEK